MFRFGRFAFAAAALLAISTGPVSAHEFWIEPDAHKVPNGADFSADLKVGQNFVGAVFPYLSNRFRSYTITDPSGTRKNVGAEGDIPSLRIGEAPPGLHIISYHSTADSLTFDLWDDFVEYIAYEGNSWAADAHLSAGFPRTGFSEQYTRCAKTLVQVGEPARADVDRAIGCPLEIVAKVSPYRLEASPDGREIPVRLLWQGKPLAGQQINIFRRGDAITRTTVVTDADGHATIPVLLGSAYLLSAVHMYRAPADSAALWLSYWASLTFEIGWQ
ncbi:MAG: DUF4198 domain-containing protein [Alphaproteobacteria bacterium]|nr:DUF4198 domain-containing protein [Alphaproteobacteria bacterium]